MDIPTNVPENDVWKPDNEYGTGKENTTN